ncbi:hypothetical protein A1OE_1238 [Candidatus Endolissoclinum faulkneri L2]|uniref:Uncharacterized protein n=1 Tax=Candidatus Endolissoclinum faulkneri L2 TaxID=1193729 RepID=K7YPG6_9PROT|nr:hypothetical protein A1OE_1238 [Candidatus Endolissoclinum faulkneri L2]
MLNNTNEYEKKNRLCYTLITKIKIGRSLYIKAIEIFYLSQCKKCIK